MTSLSERIAALSPEKRELLLRRLKTIELQGQDVSPPQALDRLGAVEVRLEPRTIPTASIRDFTTHFPLSFAQERLWFLNQWKPGSAWYNVPTALRLSGPLKVSALERNLATVVQRHEVLRTTFEEHAGRPVQVIAPKLPIQMPVIDLCGRGQAPISANLGDRCMQGTEGEASSPVSPTATERDAQVNLLTRIEAQRPFDLVSGPLLRVCLLRLDEQEHILLLTLHHIICDGWSIEVLMHEMTMLYEAEINGKLEPLPELPVQYVDYTLWQRQWLQGEILDMQLAYWSKQLADLSPLELPTDHLRPAVKTDRGARQSRLLPQAVSQGLLHLCQKLDVTLFMLGLSAF